MPKKSVARGAIGRASYDAVRKHIQQGKKATEAFALVAEETGRSKGTVQTAYYRVARSLPDGGGVKLRPRTKSARGARRGAARATGSARASRGTATGGSSASTAALAKQLSDATAALVAHIGRLEAELASARADTARLAEIERALKR